MASDKKDRGKVRFIRVRGRIIPIRPKKDKRKKDLKVGAAFLGAGGLLTAFGSLQAGKAVRKADKTAQQVIDFLKEKKGVRLPKGITGIGEGLVKSRKKFERAKFRFKGARLFGPAGIGLGIEKIISSTGIEETTGVEFASEVAGFSAGFGAESFFRKGMGQGFKKQLKVRKEVLSPTTTTIKSILTKLAKKRIGFKL